MEEKKLTDEEIVKALECCIKGVTVSNCAECPLDMIEEDCCYYTPTLIDRYALDLIHRLKKENEELKSPKFASWKLKFFNLKEEFDKELAEHEEFTKKANAEIERLKLDLENEKNWGKIQTKQAVKDTAKKFADLVEFHSISRRINGVEYFTISILGLKEILTEEFGFKWSELDDGVEVE